MAALLELWLADAPLMAMAVLLRPLLDRNPEHKALLVECLRERARRPVELRHTVPKRRKREGHFIQVPLLWLEKLDGASGQTYKLALHLAYLSWREKGGAIIVSKKPSVWDEHAFWRKLILPQEDRSTPWDGKGYRWFRSPNIVPIEQWRRREEGETER